MILKKKILWFFLLASFIGYAQKSYTIKGYLPQAKNIELELSGFQTLKEMVFAKTKSDSLGNFSLSYPAQYSGAAVLKLNFNNNEGSSMIMLLNKENFSMSWSDLQDFGTLHFVNSPENDALSKGMAVNQESEAILAGLKYLKPLYKNSSKDLQWLDNKVAIEENALPNFLKKLPAGNYVGYYLYLRKLLADMPLTANRYIERMPEHEKQFKAIDFTDPRLLQSGLLTQLIDGYYLLLESHGDVDIVTKHANATTEALLKSCNGNTALKEELAAHLFKQLEKRSLFKAAEHLALLMLNDSSCTLDEKTTRLYEQYRKMGVGQQAPDIKLTSAVKGIESLKAVTNKYKLIVFGSSWCTKCQEEIPQLKNQYQGWKDKYNLEIVFISLDTDAVQYQSFVKDFPWISSSDFKGWETQSAIDYLVYATPTMYLLDLDNKIVLKPFSAGQVNSWLIGNGGTK